MAKLGASEVAMAKFIQENFRHDRFPSPLDTNDASVSIEEVP